MQILNLKQLFLTNRQQPMQKKFVATAIGHVPWGDGAAEYFYNLYEYEDGTRECEKFDGGQYYTIPENADFSTKAQVKAWIYGGNVPRNILNIEPLIEEVNKNIKKHSVKMVMDDQDDEPMLKKMDQEIEKALHQEFKKSKKRKAFQKKSDSVKRLLSI
ncbi:hypothetical protein [Bartonella bilalgolemii]|uniref:Genomic island protein n=1 Tax=Bartonella bilalgolemii TaxID=2942911 RepID=A0ABT0PBP7_9HYPH|nr:hypothetical protein [Bartonella sp. G70]MCL6230039.1 hypothetical protein [Bartonella sp. G70]